MTAELVQLPPAPDLVDRVYRALLDAISDGSLAPGARLGLEFADGVLAVEALAGPGGGETPPPAKPAKTRATAPRAAKPAAPRAGAAPPVRQGSLF